MLYTVPPTSIGWSCRYAPPRISSASRTTYQRLDTNDNADAFELPVSGKKKPPVRAPPGDEY